METKASKTKTKKSAYALTVFSLVLLFNPNLNVIDVLPDAVAWFILAKVFERAADSALYFEEARRSFVKLGWLNLSKIAALLFIAFVRSENTFGNDAFALVSFPYAVFEAILAVQAVKNIFAALFYLGERSDAKALIEPYPTRSPRMNAIPPEALRDFSYFFVICKSILYTLPDMFLLTTENDRGQILTISKSYPYVLFLSLILGTAVGIIWLSRMNGYVKAIRREGVFGEALRQMSERCDDVKFSSKVKIRYICKALTLMTVTSFCTIELVFDNFNGINILPHFIYGILFVLSLLALKKCADVKKRTFILGASYSAVSLVAFIFSASFLSNYEYYDIVKNSAAKRAYLFVEVFSTAEFILLVLFLLSTVPTFKSFILKNTGLPQESERYGKLDKEFHGSLIKRAYLLTAFGIAAGLAKCVNVFLNGNARIIFTDIGDVTMPTITASPLPWFNLVITATAVLYIGYMMYYTSALKEEVKMKYSD